jgi:hypothetical protein
MLQGSSHVLPMAVKPHSTSVHLLVHYVTVKKRWIFWGYLMCLVRTTLRSVYAATFVHMPEATAIVTWFCNNGHPSLSHISSVRRRSAEQKTKPSVILQWRLLITAHSTTASDFYTLLALKNRRKSRLINHKTSASLCL